MIQNNPVHENYDLIQNNSNKNDNSINYTLIQVEDKNYAIKTANVIEIVKMVELDHPDGMLSCVLGIIKYKNEPISVMDLREVFKKDRIIYDLNSKIVIIQVDNVVTAIACDKVSDIKKFDKNKITKIPYQQDNDFYEGIYSGNESNFYIINPQGILSYIAGNPEKYRNDDDKFFVVNDENSKKILKERKEALIAINNELPSNISLYDSGVSFLINGIKYYINMASVKEFYKVKKSKFIKVPCTKDFIFGLINIKGEYITVVDIRKLYNNSSTSIKEKSTIIIINSDEFKIGILADEICESINIDFDEIVQNKLLKPEDNKMPEFVKNDELYQVLDIEQLLKDERLKIS